MKHRSIDEQRRQKERVMQHFRSLSEIYHEKNYENPLLRGQYPDILIRHRHIMDMVQTEKGRALDIGCGSGRLLVDLHQRGFQVLGVDYSSSMIQGSKNYFKNQESLRNPGFAVNDIENLAFKDKTFDLVVAAGVVEYLPDDKKSISEIFRVLRPGGTIIISVRNKLNLSRPIILLRYLLLNVPFLGPGLEILQKFVRRLLGKESKSKSLIIQRHIPSQFLNHLNKQHFKVEDAVFYHFGVCPEGLKKLFPNFCIRFGMKLEKYCRSRLGYFASGYLVKARRVGD